MFYKVAAVTTIAVAFGFAACGGGDGNPSPTATAGEEQVSGQSVINVSESTREEPVPLGRAVKVGDFELRVVEAREPTATELTGFAQPDGGRQYFGVWVEVAYEGPASTDQVGANNFDLLTSTGVPNAGVIGVCGDSAMPFTLEMFSGARNTYCVTYAVVPAEIEGPPVLIFALEAFGDSERVFLATR